ncbi:HEXXH motif-containing protein [Sulfitobacter guttiformis]|uniref:HEXXH motif-containing protein n=2 Tax=Sulfitobacter guttiformis TaxID=74349 RepID=A0A420DHP8_9RHOB|nr:HEXXH motif-containing protein [Sulfitobacter guttiformis]
MQNYFLPNPQYIFDTRGRIRLKLLESLKHLVFDVFGPRFTPPITDQALNDLIVGGRAFPNAVIFALHGVLLKAALSENTTDVPKALEILKDIANRSTGQPDQFSVQPLAGDLLHPDDVYLLKYAFADDLGLTTSLVAPASEVTEQCKLLVTEALETLGQTAPDWMEELQLLTNQIYFAVADTDAQQLFGGASVFDAFGAVLINPLGLKDLPRTLMSLVHESSHQQMFVYHLDDEIVLNDASASFTSPLRKQPRPMEGIFHAMWVSARMAVAAQAVLNSPNRPTWSEELREHQTRAIRAFRDCEDTVAEHAKLTDLGSILFSNSKGAVDAI